MFEINYKVLKKRWLILINEPETSFFLKLIQIITKDEGWSYKKNIFNSSVDFLAPKIHGFLILLLVNYYLKMRKNLKIFSELKNSKK